MDDVDNGYTHVQYLTNSVHHINLSQTSSYPYNYTSQGISTPTPWTLWKSSSFYPPDSSTLNTQCANAPPVDRSYKGRQALKGYDSRSCGDCTSREQSPCENQL